MKFSIKDRIILLNHQWNLKWAKSELSPCNGHSVSPDNRWLILHYKFHQDPEGRYESVIRDEEYILFDLYREHPEQELGRFRYYYNYNDLASWEESYGSQFEWVGDAILKLQEETINLNQTDSIQIKLILKKYY